MNREIKFRGLTSEGKWVYGFYCKDYSDIAYITTLDGVDTYTVIPESVGQFTGLKDKNGVDIYEEDKSNFAGKECWVRYYANMMAFGLYFPSDNTWLHFWEIPDGKINILIIGNIHEPCKE